MIQFNKLSTYAKSLLLLTASSIAFLLLFASLYYYIIKQEAEIRATSTKQFEKEINSLLSLNSESHLSTISDITYWDELVNFIKTKNLNWFESSIGSAIDVYKVDYLAVYDIKGNLLISKKTPKIISEDFIPKEMLSSLYSLKLNKFYYKIPEGIIEIFGATIHPSNDPLRNKSNPAGYFFMARLLDIKYFERLEKISSSSIHLSNNDILDYVSQGEINAKYKLLDWKNSAISTLNFSRKFNVDFKTTKDLFSIIIFAFIINLIINLWYSRKWVYQPLLLIKGVLESGNRRAIDTLKNIPGDFGYIGKLFSENIKQRNQLLDAKRKAEESDMLKSSFLTNLSHEIRTPMNAVLGFSDLLKDDNLDNDTKQNYIKIINQSGSNLLSIIDDLIEMSKIDANQVEPNLKSINLDNFLNEIYHSIKITIPKTKNIQLIYKKNQQPLDYNLITDEVKLRQVITNLITNAIKFTENGQISMSYAIDNVNNLIKFSIKDTGIGIDEKNHKIIFDRFRRVDGDYSVKVGGLGLGLAISKSYVEMLGGEISLEKSIPGKGSEFWFTIPLNISAIEDIQVIESIENQVKSSGKKTILVAEDDNINYLLIEKIMLLKNYTILRAKDGIEAVEISKKFRSELNLILMDIKMPKLNGYEALAQIRNEKIVIPILAQTAYSTTDEIDKLKNAGFDNYITKPIKKEKLFELLDMYLQ